MLTYKQYLDKVYGCWLGKCVAGTIGAPYEGMKQLLHLSFRSEMIEKMLPNDDLDLQVLWLKVLEEKGIYTTGDDLAAAQLESWGNLARNAAELGGAAIEEIDWKKDTPEAGSTAK